MLPREPFVMSKLKQKSLRSSVTLRERALNGLPGCVLLLNATIKNGQDVFFALNCLANIPIKNSS
jgi:hypothetical protein